jgi:methionyl-tRNA formyltransferase
VKGQGSKTSVNSYRILFAGTPDFAASALKALLNSRHEILAVYTQPDRPAGRGRKLAFSPVKELAISKNIAVEQPLNFKDPENLETLQSFQADIMIVAAYGIILPRAVLEAFPLGCINIHASLLPRWRGAAPIQRAVLAGDSETGITIMKMDEGLDTGDMLLKKPVAISETDTGSSLHDKLAKLGGQAIEEALDSFELLNEQRCQQDEALVTYAQKLEKKEAHIYWNQDAATIARQIRAFNSWPVSFAKLEDKNIRIWHAEAVEQEHSHQPGEIVQHEWQGKASIIVACKSGLLKIDALQLPGKKILGANEVLNSKRDVFQLGKCFE